MNHFDIYKLKPNEFEELCIRLISKAGWKNIEYHGASGSDKGRDIVASKAVEFLPGHLSLEKWIIQCKRTKKLTLSDLTTEISKIAQFDINNYLLITSSLISSSLRDSIPGLCHRFALNINIIDGLELRHLIEDQYPEIFPASIRDRVMSGSISDNVRHFFARSRVILEGTDPSLEQLLREYFSLGYIARIRLLSEPYQTVYVAPEDAVFHCITANIEKPSDILATCGGRLDMSLLQDAIDQAQRTIRAIRNCDTISFDWKDTLVDEFDLDEHICDELSTSGSVEPAIQARERLEFHRIMTSLHARADQRWYDYGYLAELMGKSIQDVFNYHDSFNRHWGFFSGVRELLDTLATLRGPHGKRIGIITNCYRNVLEYRAKLLGLDLGIFDFVMTGDMVSEHHDKEELLHLALERTNTDTGKFVHFGNDVQRDVLPANRLGCLSVLVSTVIPRYQSFWTSAIPPRSRLLAELKHAENPKMGWGLVSSASQIAMLWQ